MNSFKQDEQSSKETENNLEYPALPAINGQTQSDDQQKKNGDSRLKIIGVLGIIIVVIAIGLSSKMMSGDINTGLPAQTALQQGFSKSLPAGAILLAKDANTLAKDYTLTFQADLTKQQQSTIQLLVWDYAAVDGDYVQLYYNGVAFTDAFMIDHTPKVFTLTVSHTGTNAIQVRGIQDGGGGITYALMFKGQQLQPSSPTFYNAAPIGGINTYTLIAEPLTGPIPTYSIK